MKKIIIMIVSLLFSLTQDLHPQEYENYKNLKGKYIQLSGSLFESVQLSGIFKDSKTFVDAVPEKEQNYIRSLYDSVKILPDFNLEQFVFSNFKIPSEQATDTIKLPKGQSMDAHIESLWKYLLRKPDTLGNSTSSSTLIPLKHPYIVPGGRFREIYYWDSFFTILGLLSDKKINEAENMVANFAYLLDQYKMIPNGNRIYYLTRSQPPFFALMVDIICRYKNDFKWGLKYLSQMQREYDFWMNGLNALSKEMNSQNIKASQNGKASERTVMLNDGQVLNRYYDFDDKPREESFKADYELSDKVHNSMRPEMLRNIRAAAESGWDFSSRWFKDGKTLLTIQTTDIIPIDLNCLLYFLENRLSFFYKLNGNDKQSDLYEKKASLRADLINKIFWDENKGYFFDYNWKTGSNTGVYSLAALYPLYFGIAKKEQASSVSKVVEQKFLKPGGLVTTLTQTKQQWDAPNGWPPLQWIAVKGLREYGFNSLADNIRQRWLKLNETVFKRTGKMLEKYNVIDLNLFAGGGEYPLQDGFGWTNGVASAFLSNFDKTFLFKNKK
ncbi:MAG: alpha,alpha-trehalase TreF [Bacteroidota bacterium]|nr:alpha,alpha-trehalase TreF [Bacteroidota bacterium]